MYYGDYAEDATVYIPFNTFTSDDPSASSTITDFVNTDIHIHKDNAVAQRNNAAGITVATNFDGITGNHLVTIDTADDTVAAFWVAGHDYHVRIEGTTVDGATINAWIGSFSIENRFMRGTDSAATASVLGQLNDAAAAGEVTEADTLVQYVKQLLNILIGEAGIGAFPAEAAPANAVSLAEVIRAIHVDVTGLNGSAMAGTDGANTTVPDAAGVAPTAAEIKTEVEQAGSSLAQILADTGTDGVILKAAGLNADAVDEIFDEEVDNDGTAISLRGALKVILAVLTGKSSGGGGVTIVFRDINDAKNRISATVDANGNRTAVGTRDAS